MERRRKPAQDQQAADLLKRLYNDPRYLRDQMINRLMDQIYAKTCEGMLQNGLAMRTSMDADERLKDFFAGLNYNPAAAKAQIVDLSGSLSGRSESRRQRRQRRYSGLDWYTLVGCTEYRTLYGAVMAARDAGHSRSTVKRWLRSGQIQP